MRKVIPEQKGGGKSDTEYSKEFVSVEEAEAHFKKSKERLLHVEGWTKYAAADFRLFDSNGGEVNRNVQEGDFFCIDIPGPGTIEGKGYDWVQVEKIEEENNEQSSTVFIRVRPAQNPNSPHNEVAHFFSPEATSTFIIERRRNTISAEVHGRNEHANTETSNPIDKTRNALVATGAIAGLAKVQWGGLVKGLVEG